MWMYNKIMKNSRMQQVKEVDFGVYVWMTADNQVVKDEDGNYLMIHSMRNDIEKMGKLRKAAAYYGVPPGGHPMFIEGARAVSDEEYETQKERLAAGEVPDEKDGMSLLEEGINDRRRRQ